MIDWHLNPALTNFRREVNARWPSRDKTSDGTIGDAAHQATSSDHNPDLDGSVDAWDMDVDGVDVWACINAALKHEATQYVIYNHRITSRTWGLGIWRDYDGPSPHTEHVHFNTRTAYENSSKPWFQEDEMELTDLVSVINDARVKHTDSSGNILASLTFGRLEAQTNYYAIYAANVSIATAAKVNDLAQAVAELKNQPVTVNITIDNPEVLDEIATRTADLLAQRMQA